jgi:adenylate cyclase
MRHKEQIDCKLCAKFSLILNPAQLKNTICLLVFLSQCCFLLAQSDAILSLEKTTAKVTGEDFINNALTLADWLYNEGFFEKSVQWAEKAGEAAKKLKHNNYLAISLNQKAKSQMKISGKRQVMKSKAYKSFEESNAITTDAALKLDNLWHMKDLAVELDKKKDLDKIQREINLLNGSNGSGATTSSGGGLFSKRKKAQEEYERAKAQNQQLAAAVNSLSEEKASLAQQQQSLQTLIEAKETAIQNMTAAQIKQELLVSEQTRMLDSLQFAGAMDSMKLAQKDMVVLKQQAELQQKQAEIDLRNSQRKLLLAVVGLVAILGGALFLRYQTISKHNVVLSEKNSIIEAEKRRSEELLLNILPASIADELKKNGSAVARRYENASVLFTDFQGFSAISKQLSPEKLVNDLDYAFKNFDRIIGEHGLEKIKTIGDAYMCAGGLPEDGSGHPRDVVRAGLAIQRFLADWNMEKKRVGEPPFEARIGIHTGPLVAGVVGSRKFAYDIWGDTVNVASRMETTGDIGKVNISAATYSFVKDEFNCEYRGKVPAKNVGEVEMYFVS